jgi:hypothetical protein
VSLTGTDSTLSNSTIKQGASAFLGPCVVMGEGATIRNVAVSGASLGPAIPAVTLIGPGNTVDGLKITGPAGLTVGNPIFAAAGERSTLRRLDVAVSGTAGFPVQALGLFGDATVSDSLVQSASTSTIPGFGGAAITAAGNVRLRNVTALATGSSAQGVQVMPGATAPAVSVKNSILRGDSAANDLVVMPGAPGLPPGTPGCTPPTFPGCSPTLPGDVQIDHSNFRGATSPPDSVDATANGSADPQFTDAAAGNFRPKAGAPLINAGVSDPDNGTTDLDGKARKSGSAVDIGAYEFQQAVPRPRTPITPRDPGGPPTVTPGPLGDLIRPVVGGLELTNRRFRVARASTPVTTAAAKRGTTFVYSLSELARVQIAIQGASTGRRKGRSCVKTTRRNRKGKKCTRYATVGTLTRAGQPGANALPFSGRIGRKALKPAKYRARFTATDAAGNVARRKPTISFTIVKR